jgi:hypothetical protein
MSSQQHINAPSTTSETYTCTKITTLIDLNTDATNFKSFFSAESENGEPFYLVIADQDALDSGKSLEFNKVSSGKISGEIVADKNEYKNYLLILKSEVPTIVRLDTTFERLPDYISPSSSSSTTPSPFNALDFTPSLNKILAGLLVAVILILFLKKYLLKTGGGVGGGKNSLLDKLKKINK